MIRAVGLDATGTLFRPRDVGGEYAHVLARHGIEIEPSRLAELFPEVWRELACSADPAHDRFLAHPGGARGYWRDLLDRVCARAGAPRPSAFAAAELFERFAQGEPWELFDDVAPALERLREAGLRLVLISNWDERLPRVLDALGLAPRLDAVVFSAEVGVEKPHPAIFAAATRAAGATPAESVHVGDRRLEDREGAQAAGWHGLLLDRAGGGDLASLAELPERLSGLG